MRTHGSSRALALSILIWPFLLPGRLEAQEKASTGSPPPEEKTVSLEDLARLVRQQQQQLEAQELEIEKLRDELQQTSALALAAHNRLEDMEERPPDATVTAAVEQRLAALEQSVQEIPELPPDLVSAGDFPGSMRVPGTDAALRIGGQARSTLALNLDALGSDDRFVASSIPIAGTQEAGKTSRATYSVRPSRFNLDVRTPTGVGSMRAFFEADAANAGDGLRLRHAYGQRGAFLAGQTWSTFADPEAEPDGIDFEGLNAISLFRQPQFRWSPTLRENLSLSLAVESPRPDITGASGVSQVPDLVARLRWTPGQGRRGLLFRRTQHVHAAILLRQIRGEAEDQPNQTLATVGWGLNISGKSAAPWLEDRDYLTYAFYAGEGIGRYINDLSNVGGQDAVYDPETDTLRALQALSGYVGYQHFWTDRVRSTATFGIVEVQNLSIQSDDALKKTVRASLNLAWSPIPRLDLIGEFLWGQRWNKDNRKGSASQVQLGTTFRF